MTLKNDMTTAEGDPPSAVLSCLHVLKQRRDFQRLSRGKRVAMGGFVLQTGPRATDMPVGIGIGFTCSKKVGNAVARNHAKRRLREIARLELPQAGLPGQNYVLIGRHKTTSDMPFDQLRQDFRKALSILNGQSR